MAEQHTKKISAVKYSNIADSNLQHVIMTASEDGTVKLWDRRNGDCVRTLSQTKGPFFSLDHNKHTICAGAFETIYFWDLRKMKLLETYTDSHSDDVTCVRYCSHNPDLLLTCATDNLCCQFDFKQKPSNKEEDTIEGTYSSNQPLIDCRFIGKDKFWVTTSVNTIEVCDYETAEVLVTIDKVSNFLNKYFLVSSQSGLLDRWDL